MDKKAYRTSMPFDRGLSPLTDKSRAVPLFGDTPLIQDILNGTVTKKVDVHSRGEWAKGEHPFPGDKDTSKNYREEGDQFMLKERIRDRERERHINNSMGEPQEEWVAVMQDGTSYSFPSKEVAISTLDQMKKPYSRLFRKMAQVEREHSIADRTKSISEAMNACVMVESAHADGTREIGAGFCVRGGLFITCAHVVGRYDKNKMPDEKSHEDKIRNITLDRNGERAPATILGMDLKKDIAVLQSEMPSVILELGSEHDVNVGEEVFAIGSPKGFENNVSSGIISSKGCRIFWYKGAPRYIFTDAHVLPGNSGGPLVAYKDGRVVGMMAMIVGGDGLYGLNVALPSDEISAFLVSLES